MALLYLGNDAAQAMTIVNSDEALRESGLSGNLTIEFYRKPIHFKRRIAELPAQETKVYRKKKED